MGIFTRVRDIISSNINAMLDKAEDPEKMVRLMIQEMEDTLVEIRASCAGAMATKKKIGRQLDESKEKADQWESKAKLAISKGREDLAREALHEKKRYTERVDSLEREMEQATGLIEQYQADIRQLEDKLNAARERQAVLVQRHIHAQHKTRAQNEIRKAETQEAMMRFDKFEQRIDRMEAKADLVNYGKRPTLDDEFAKLEDNEDIEKELEDLREQMKKSE
ncbi:MAG: phage shock protein PspA [Candidatus Omnitrophica bacterium]|nr:phage shock protein PspA [Candidatus Omnitrophota bacterium]